MEQKKVNLGSQGWITLMLRRARSADSAQSPREKADKEFIREDRGNRLS